MWYVKIERLYVSYIFQSKTTFKDFKYWSNYWGGLNIGVRKFEMLYSDNEEFPSNDLDFDSYEFIYAEFSLCIMAVTVTM